MILVTTSNNLKELDSSNFKKVITLKYQSASILRFKIAELILENNADNLIIVMPDDITNRVWSSRHEEYRVFDKENSDDFIGHVSKLMFNQVGATDEWALSISAISYAINDSCKIYCNTSLKEKIKYPVRDNIIFYNELRDINF
jgi:hypothetical protein